MFCELRLLLVAGLARGAAGLVDLVVAIVVFCLWVCCWLLPRLVLLHGCVYAAFALLLVC